MAQLGGDRSDGVDHPVVERHRLEPGQRALLYGHSLGGRGFGHEPGQVGLRLPQEGLIRVAEVHRQPGAGGDDVDQVRVELQAPDGGHLAPTHPDRQLAHVGGDQRRHVAGVVAKVHGRGARMVGLAGDGQLRP